MFNIFNKSSIRARLAKGVMWSTLGAVISRASALVVSIITARIIGKECFGELGIIQSTISMFTTFASLGMGLTATKYIAEYKTKDPVRAGRIIGMSSIISWVCGTAVTLVVVIFAPYLASHTLAAPHLSDILRLGALSLIFTVVNEAQIGALNGFEAFKSRSLIQSIAGIISFPISVVGVYFFGLVGAVCCLALSQAILVYLNFREIKKEALKAGFSIDWIGVRSEIRVLWSFSLPTILGASIYVPAMWLANAFIVQHPDGYAEMGLFNAADRWRTAILFVPMLVGGVSLPMLSNLRAENLVQKYYKVLWTNVALCFIVALVVALPIAIISPWIMNSYGSGFAEGKWILIGLCILAVITSTFWVIGQSIVSEGRMWFLLMLNACWATLLLSISWYLHDKGARGLVIAYLFADIVRLIIAFVFTYRRHRITSTTATI